MSSERVTIFIDGSNLYHAMKAVYGRADLRFTTLAERLTDDRVLVRTYYYNAAVIREDGEAAYQAQQKFFGALRDEPYLEVKLGRLVKRGQGVVEKGVDVQIATDMLLQAHSGAYDTAILVSGDSDYVPAVNAVKTIGRHVEVAFTREGRAMHLKQACDRFILLNDILKDCWIR